MFGARASVLLDAHKNLVALTNSLSPDAERVARSPKFVLTPAQVIAQAYARRFATHLPSTAVLPRGQRGEWLDCTVTAAAGAPRVLEVSSKRVLFPSDTRLVPAYHIELLTRAGDGDQTNRGYGEVVAADDGRSSWNASLTASDSFHDRVWADSKGVPADAPLTDATPHPSGTPDRVRSTHAAPTMVTVEGLNRSPDGTLAGRMAWAGESAGYPSFQAVSIDLGMRFAGKTIKIRFRVGTDDGTGEPGWDIDRIAFGTSAFDGITNTPFPALFDDAGACNGR